MFSIGTGPGVKSSSLVLGKGSAARRDQHRAQSKRLRNEVLGDHLGMPLRAGERSEGRRLRSQVQMPPHRGQGYDEAKTGLSPLHRRRVRDRATRPCMAGVDRGRPRRYASGLRYPERRLPQRGTTRASVEVATGEAQTRAIPTCGRVWLGRFPTSVVSRSRCARLYRA